MERRGKCPLFASIVVAAIFVALPHARAQEACRAATTVLIAVEDIGDDQETARRRDRVATDVIREIGKTIRMATCDERPLFQIIDHVAAVSSFAQAQSIRAKREQIISITKAIREPAIDLLVLVAITPTVSVGANFNSGHLRIRADVMNVRTGALVASSDKILKPHLTFPMLCPEACEKTRFDPQVTPLAGDVGEQLRVDIVRNFVRRTYNIRIVNLTVAQRDTIKRHLETTVPGQGALRIDRETTQGWYRYETQLDEVQLSRWLQEIIDRMRLPSRSLFQDGEFVIE